MKRNSILLCLLFAIAANFIAPAAKAQINTTDSLALVDLYNSTNGPHWRNHTNWLTANPVSTWHGISVTGSNVTKVKLSSNYLSGTLPVSIGNLSFLTYLDLSGNQLSGNIPASVGNLTRLSILYLYSNQLSGTIPVQIGNLSTLTELNLSFNYGLTGTIPAQIGNLTKLTNLNLGNNQLSGTIPAQIGNLTNLTYLNLSSNPLTGAIPVQISNLKNVTAIYLFYDSLSGTIPAEIGNLKHLYLLSLFGNQLSGAIPASLDKLTNCNISLNNNHLSQFGDFQASKDTNSHISCNISYNYFTFNELQPTAKYLGSVYNYIPQDTILPIHQNGNILSVSAGGTLSKNTYFWHKVGDAGKTTVKGDSTFSPVQSGMYYATVINKIVSKLILQSDTISYTMPLAQTKNSIANNAAIEIATTRFSIYPNPASSIIHIKTAGTATIILTNSAGTTLLTKTINNSDDINVSKYPNGVYYIQNKTSGETQKVVIVH